MQTDGAAIVSRRETASPWYFQLWFQVLVAMVIGIALGHWYPALGARMQPLGDAFIKAIRVLIAPIIFCTVVHGISSMANMAKVGRVALKALIYFEVLTTIALGIGLIAVNVFKPGVGMNVDLSHVDTSTVAAYVERTHTQNTEQFLINIIPDTFVSAFSEGNVLQVLYISVLCGFSLSWMGKAGKPLNDLIEASSQMLFRIVAVVMWAAPLGAFGAIAFTVGRFGATSLLSLGELLISFYVTCLIFIFGVLWPIAHWFGFSLLKFIRYIWEELLIVFATTSSETVLPRMIAKLEDAGCEESVVGLVIPMGYSLQSRWHVPLSRHRRCIPGPSNKYPPHRGATVRPTWSTSVGIEGCSRCCGCCIRCTRGDSRLRRIHTSRKRSFDTRSASFAIRRPDTDRLDRQWGGYHCRCQMGKSTR